MASINVDNDELPETLHNLKRIVESSLAGIAIIGSKRKIEYVNDKVCEIIGRSRDEVLGNDFQTFVHQDSSELVMKRYAKRRSGETIPPLYEARVIRTEDDIRDVLICTSVLRTNDEKTKILAHVLDITEEKKTKRALSQSEKKYRTLVENMNEGLGIIDDKGVMIYANAALCKMLDYTELELTGKSAAEMMAGLTFEAVFKKIQERISGKTGRYETHLIHRTGRLIPSMVSASPLFDNDGEFLGSFAIFSDRTEQMAIERELKTARDKAMLYLDLMGHDIRNHLQEIQVSTELLLFGTSDNTYTAHLENVLKAVSKSAKIISETRTFEQLTKQPLRERLLDETLTECVETAIVLLDDVDIRLSIQVPRARIKADDYLEILLSNLLGNAYERNPGGEKRVWIELKAGEGSYELIVSDNGPGIPDKVKSNLFDSRSRFGGVDFHLVYHIIEKYEGTMEVLNRVQDDQSRGTKIKITFPKLPQLYQDGI
ncbi:MAG: PAS domain S-box protein [Candidatus Thorarchaeota archaeon]|jgi:PAS domain S-box-containing protein